MVIPIDAGTLVALASGIAAAGALFWRVKTLEKRLDEHLGGANDVKERLARLETKVDLLLDKSLK